MPDEPLNVLFLCTGNSCRSQMAEGWLRTLGGDAFAAQSAGIEAHGKNPRAIAVMREAGVDISGQESTVVTGSMIAAANVVVTVCGHADEQCPALPPAVKKLHWPLTDPAKVEVKPDRVKHWMDQGAKPTDTVKSIFKREGVFAATAE